MSDFTHKLMLHNDDKNTASYVMACLIRFCKHEPLQAEQCTIIANNTGKCSIKTGDYLEMLDLQNYFEKVSIKTEIIEYESFMY